MATTVIPEGFEVEEQPSSAIPEGFEVETPSPRAAASLPDLKAPIPAGLQGPAAPPDSPTAWGRMRDLASHDLGEAKDIAARLGKATLRNNDDILAATGPMLSPEYGGLSNIPPSQEQRQKFTEATETPVLPISAAIPEPTPGESPVTTGIRGIAKGVEGFTSPQNLALMAGTAGSGAIASQLTGYPAVAVKVLNGSLGTFFATQAAVGMGENYKAAYDAYQKGDLQGVAEHLGTGTVDGLFAAFGLKHAVTSGRDILATRIDRPLKVYRPPEAAQPGQVAAGTPGEPPTPGAPPEEPLQPPKPTQSERVSPATPNPPTAAQPTAPETPETIAVQLQQLATGGRKAVMFPKGTPAPTVYPPGTAVTSDGLGNTYVFRPDLTTRGAIKRAAKNNTLPEILGSAQMGMGAPDKSAIEGEPITVVTRAADGTEVQSTGTDAANLPVTLAANQQVTPPGGTVTVEPPASVINERLGNPDMSGHVPIPPPQELSAPAPIEAPAAPPVPVLSPADQALEFIRQNPETPTSAIQRQFKLGYGAATRLQQQVAAENAPPAEPEAIETTDMSGHVPMSESVEVPPAEDRSSSNASRTTAPEAPLVSTQVAEPSTPVETHADMSGHVQIPDGFEIDQSPQGETPKIRQNNMLPDRYSSELSKRYLDGPEKNAVKWLNDDFGNFSVPDGAQLVSQSGRRLSPAPKFDDSTNRKRKLSLSRQREWLVGEARKEAASQRDGYMGREFGYTDPENYSRADASMVNGYLFGDPDGPRAEHVVDATPKKQPAPARDRDLEAPASIETHTDVSGHVPMSESEPAEPVKWFGTEAKAAEYIKKKKLGGTHQVVKANRRFEVQEKAKPETKQEFASTQTNLTGPVADALQTFAESIPDDKLTEGGRETEPHITVKYGLHADDATDVAKILDGESPIDAKLGKTSIFRNEDSDVLKVDVESPDLHRLNGQIAELPHTDTFPDYQPHATIAYLKPGEGDAYDGKSIPGVTGETVVLGEVKFSGKDGEATTIPLKGDLARPADMDMSGHVRKVTPAKTEHPVTYFTGKHNEAIAERAKIRKDIGLLVTPLKPDYLAKAGPYPVIAIDNGVFSKAQAFSAEKFRKLIKQVAADPEVKAKVRFVVAPDVIGDAAKTLEQFPEWADEIHQLGLPVALAAQDGLEDRLDQIPWDKVDVLFIGGSTEWKIGTHEPTIPSKWIQIFRDAAKNNVPTHMGRVNSAERLNIAEYGLGMSSVDGTYLAYGPDINLGRLEGWLNRQNNREDLDDSTEPVLQDDREPWSAQPDEEDWERERKRAEKRDLAAPTDIETRPDMSVSVSSTAEPKTELVRANEDLGTPQGLETAKNADTIQTDGTRRATSNGQRGTERDGSQDPEALAGVPPELRSEPQGEERAVSDRGASSDQPRRDVQPGEERRPSSGSGDGTGAGRLDSTGERAPRGESGDRISSGDLTRETTSRDYRITDASRVGEGGPREKIRANIEAIRLVKTLEKEGRPATPEEQHKLARYVGWGAFPQVFDWRKTDFAGMREDLQSLLTPEEYRAAEASTKNAHYTSPDVVRSMWDAMERFGVKPGFSVIEPSMGSGNFFGLQPDALLPARRTGVELDKITGAIAKALYPDSNVQVTGFEKIALPDNFFDVAISNVPFGNIGVYDPKYKRNQTATESIHNYFFVKGLDLVRPGGIVGFITSRYTMDAQSNALRKQLAAKADLVGMIRLPDTAFKSNAGTEVVTDVVFLRKRAPGEPEAGESFLNSVDVPVGKETTKVNEYYAAHPEMMIGTLSMEGSQYAANQQTLKGEITPAILKKAIDKLPRDIFKEWKPETPVFEGNDAFVDLGDAVKDGGYDVKDGVVVQRDGNIYRPVAKLGKLPEERIKGMLPIRAAVRDVYASQITEASPKEIIAARNKLNKAYDAFVKKFGPINSIANARAMGEDPDFPVIAAIEDDYDKETNTAKKAAIFSQRTIERPKSPDKADKASEALAISLNETGRIDWDRMQQLTGKTPNEMREELGGIVYQNPDGQRFETSDEYLSGNVRQKLDMAREAARANPKYDRNVEALEKVQPRDLTPEEIKATLGAPWIPANVVANFMKNLLTLDGATVHYSPLVASWSVNVPKYMQDRTANSKTYGTEDFRAHELVDMALNGKAPRVYREGPNDTRILDTKATSAAQTALDALKEKFKEWIWEQPFAGELAEKYNREMNNLRLVDHDGSHLTLPGSNPAIQLRPHQKNVIWRALKTGNTLLAHEVGAGKAQPLDAKVLTPLGWKLMGEIRVGDEVIAGDGSVTTVEAVFPQGPKDIFRVHFSDGSATECCDEHLWETRTYRERNYAQRSQRLGKAWECAKPKVRSLAEIRQSLRANHLNAVNHSIAVVAPVQFAAQDIPIDPYLMGVLLGDGNFTSDRATITNPDEEVIEACRESLLGTDLKLVQHAAVDRCPTWGIAMVKRSTVTRNSLVEALASLGLQGCKSEAKFIPEAYFVNTFERRLALLQGLMDTDGTIGRKGYATTFTTASPRLSDGLTALVQSLGGIVRRSERTPTYTYRGERRTGQRSYTLAICLPPSIQPFRLSRKRELVKPKTKYQPIRYIESVEPAGVKPAQCIRVAHASHLYVTDQFIVTHNTWEMVGIAMESRRLGMAKKPVLVVPNHMAEQVATEFAQLYPAARVLVVGKEDFSATRRKKAIARISSGTWDAVILRHSSFEKIPVSDETYQQFVDSQIEELRAALDEQKAAVGGKGADKDKSVKEIQKAISRLEVKLQKRLARENKDDAATFEQLGIDLMLVDEAHAFKALNIITRRTRVAGIPTRESNRATDMYMKTQYISRLNGGQRGVIFATGTPVTNTMAELYNMQRYLQPEAMKQAGVAHFDAWANTFGEILRGVELDVSGKGFRENERFAKFINIPELMTMYRQVADVKTAEMMKLPRPDLEGGGPKAVSAPETEALKAFVESLVERTEKIRKGSVDPAVDNMLKVVSEGKKAALDIRLIDPDAEDVPTSKVNKAVDNIFEIWRDTKKDNLTQIVFCDLSTPKLGKGKKGKAKPAAAEEEATDENESSAVPEAAGERAGFSVYDDMKRKLISMGIPSNEIAFIHDADTDTQKQELFDAVNAGKVRVLMGSTEKMGVGTNVQKRAIALHHMDAPWRPADIKQRDGRIQRQGNMNKTVKIFQYLTEGSFDAYSWQLLENKARFIGPVLSGELSIREMEDIGMVLPSAAEFKAMASGNPLIREKIGTDAALGRLDAQRAGFRRQQAGIQQQLSGLPSKIASAKRVIDEMSSDVATIEKDKDAGYTIGKTKFAGEDARKKAAEALHAALESWKGPGNPQQVGTFKGLEIWTKPSYLADAYPGITLRGEHSYPANSNPESPAGTLASIENVVRGIADRLPSWQKTLEEDTRALTELKAAQGKTFPQEAKYQELLKKKAEIDAQLAESEAEKAAAIEEAKKPAPASSSVTLGSGLGALQPALEAVGEAAKQFTREEIIPKVADILSGARDTVETIVHWANPRSGVPTKTLDETYKLKGGRDATDYLLTRKLDHWAKEVSRLSEDDMVNFIDRMKTGHKQKTDSLQQLAEFLRSMDDALYDLIKKYRPSLEYLENHFRVLWDIIPGSPEAKAAGLNRVLARLRSKRPLEGGRGFLKQAKLADMTEGLELGGKPVTVNPIEMFKLHYADSMKFVTAQKMWERFGEMGVRKFVKTGRQAPEGFVKLDDRIARVYFPVEEGLVNAGEWYVEEGAGRVLNNYLSRDRIREHAFGRFMLAVKNITTSIELSWSPFHAIFEANEAIGSEIGIGLRQMANLGLRRGDRAQFLKGVGTIAKAPASFVTTAKLGSMAKKTYGDFVQTPEGKAWLKLHPDAPSEIEDFFNGGGKLGMHEDYKLQAGKGFKEFWNSARAGGNPGHYVSAAVRAIPEFSQFVMKPLFDHYIPNLKLGFFLKEYSLAKAEYADRLASGEMTRLQLARQVVDSIDNRFGEMNFDNLFWNRTFKTANQLQFRSVTWKLGNLRATTGAVTGEFGEFKRARARKEAPLLHPNSSWFLGMSLWTAVLGGTITTLAGLMAGKKLGDAAPKEVKDFVYPVIDAVAGIRVSLPTYWRDLIHLRHNPVGYFTSSLSGIIGRLADIWENKDFFGNEVWHPDDPFPQKAWDGAKSLMPLPFMLSGRQQARQQGGNLAAQVAPMLGFSKAPRYIEQTDAEELASEYMGSHREVGARTKQQAEASSAKSGIRNIYRRGGDPSSEIHDAEEKGYLQRKDVSKLQKQSKQSTLSLMMPRLSVGEALRVYDKASDTERAEIRRLVRNKAMRDRSKAHEWDAKSQMLAEKYFGIRRPQTRPAFSDLGAPVEL